jgi:hypothetical protein
VEWREVERTESMLKLRFEQTTSQPYLLKLPVVIKSSTGETFRTDVLLDKQVNEAEIKLPFQPQQVEVDPLFENLAKISSK